MARWVGGWVYELKIRLNSATVGVELKLKLKLSLATIWSKKLLKIIFGQKNIVKTPT